mmetsp:Transcript_31960/g.72116  ORF Transcript_31960/g.72116 Transcript_31960/m.72116 type:complete len:123 (+) Transcript_31960:1367-1735(+)
MLMCALNYGSDTFRGLELQPQPQVNRLHTDESNIRGGTRKLHRTRHRHQTRKIPICDPILLMRVRPKHTCQAAIAPPSERVATGYANHFALMAAKTLAEDGKHGLHNMIRMGRDGIGRYALG